jgi:quercetin dioxygenase-like cupin family protein
MRVLIRLTAPVRQVRPRGVCIHHRAVTAFAAEQIIERHIRQFAFDVPQRHVDRAEGGHGDGAAPKIGAAIEELPDVLAAARVHTDKVGDQVVGQVSGGQGFTVFRFVEFEPEDPEVMKTLDGRAAFAEMGAADRIKDNQRHPFMHRTDSVDYAVVVKGKIVMMMDEEEDDLVLEAGDVLVQRGNNHAWSNKFDETCIIAFVLMDADGDIDRW